MPNIRSAKKRVSVSGHKTLSNKRARSSLKTSLKKAQSAVAEGDKAAAGSAYINAQKALDKAVARGLIPKNAAARRKSQLVKAMKKA